jgi:hypothetical protein
VDAMACEKQATAKLMEAAADAFIDHGDIEKSLCVKIMLQQTSASLSDKQRDELDKQITAIYRQQRDIFLGLYIEKKANRKSELPFCESITAIDMLVKVFRRIIRES